MTCILRMNTVQIRLVDNYLFYLSPKLKIEKHKILIASKNLKNL